MVSYNRGETTSNSCILPDKETVSATPLSTNYLDGHLSGTPFPDGELDVVYRLQKIKQNGRLLYCSYQLVSNFQLFIFSWRDLKNLLTVAVIHFFGVTNWLYTTRQSEMRVCRHHTGVSLSTGGGTGWQCWLQTTEQKEVRGPPLDSQGGGAGVFVAGKLFISTGLGGALKISHFVTCLYVTVLEVNYLFHAESARNYLFQKYSCPPGNLMVAP